MVKVYIFAGFTVVILVAITYLVLLVRGGLGLFRFKKKEKAVGQEPPEGARWHRPSDGGSGYWV